MCIVIDAKNAFLAKFILPNFIIVSAIPGLSHMLPVVLQLMNVIPEYPLNYVIPSF